ncbi:hypothetical protein CDAR_376531, partial [Caerostris darwini]
PQASNIEDEKSSSSSPKSIRLATAAGVSLADKRGEQFSDNSEIRRIEKEQEAHLQRLDIFDKRISSNNVLPLAHQKQLMKGICRLYSTIVRDPQASNIKDTKIYPRLGPQASNIEDEKARVSSPKSMRLATAAGVSLADKREEQFSDNSEIRRIEKGQEAHLQRI